MLQGLSERLGAGGAPSALQRLFQRLAGGKSLELGSWRRQGRMLSSKYRAGGQAVALPRAWVGAPHLSSLELNELLWGCSSSVPIPGASLGGSQGALPGFLLSSPGCIPGKIPEGIPRVSATLSRKVVSSWQLSVSWEFPGRKAPMQPFSE